jgi:hypothetical protein
MALYEMPLPRRRLRACVFEAQSVVLKFPARRASGVRDDDGVVVFAIQAADVRVDEFGSRCLLWTPRGTTAAAKVDPASSDERLEHCRIAVRHGGAEGFLVHRGSAPRERDEVFPVRVERAGESYWARWGSVTRVARSATRMSLARR